MLHGLPGSNGMYPANQARRGSSVDGRNALPPSSCSFPEQHREVKWTDTLLNHAHRRSVDKQLSENSSTLSKLDKSANKNLQALQRLWANLRKVMLVNIGGHGQRQVEGSLSVFCRQTSGFQNCSCKGWGHRLLSFLQWRFCFFIVKSRRQFSQSLWYPLTFTTLWWGIQICLEWLSGENAVWHRQEACCKCGSWLEFPISIPQPAALKQILRPWI